MKKVKIGIIGTGVGIRTHLKGFRLFEDAEVVAICGSSADRSTEFAKKHNIPIACADYKELCDLEELDLVCVTTPNRYHIEAVKYAISKGKNIICEKPLSNDSKEVRTLVKMVNHYPHIAVVDHQLRFNPYIRKIKEMITMGQLGNIISVKIFQTGSGFANPNAPWTWSFDGEEGGGVRLAMVSHFTDLIQYWFGERKVIDLNGYLNPVTKQRTGKDGILKTVTGSTICTAHINLENELNVTFSTNAGSYIGSSFDIDIFGTKGELTFSLKDKLLFYSRENVGQKQEVEVENVYQDEAENKVSIFSSSFRYFVPLIIKAIQTNEYSSISDSATFASAQYNLDVLDAIRQSSNSGMGVVLGKENNNYV